MNLIKYLCIILSLLSVHSFASGQSSNEIPNQSSAPSSSLLSELGDLFLQVDEMVYKLKYPTEQNENAKQEHETNYGNRNLRTNYFDQVRQNYGELQKKIQESLENPAKIFTPPEILNLNFQNRGQKSFLDLSLPFLPMNVQLKGKEVKDSAKFKEDSITPKLPKVDYPLSDLSGSISIGGEVSNPRRIQSNPIKDEGISTSSDFHKRSDLYDMGLNQRDKNHGPSPLPNQLPMSILQEIGAENDGQFNSREADIEGRVLGNLLYSEDTFDKHFKKLLRDGKWVVDPKVFFPKEVVENVREFTKNKLTNEKDNEKSTGNQVLLNPDTRTRDNKNKSSFQRQKPSESETKSDILLAFTLDGVPLKLKVNPIHGNPLKYLNRALMTAGVSLNIPIESHRNLQPAGKDVLQLGSRSDGGQTHATYVDLTDENQLTSLLETLKYFKN